MRVFQTRVCVLMVLLGMIVHANAGVFFALKALKEGLPLLAATGLLGALKLTLMSKASFALGTLGTVLGAAALSRDKPKTVVMYKRQPKGYGHDHGYDRDWGRTYDAEEDFQEEDFEYVRKDDPSYCTERLVCEIGTKAAFYPSQMTEDEIDILNLVKNKPHKFGDSSSHASLRQAMDEGFNGSNCAVTYHTCSFNSSQMLSLVKMFSKNILQNSWDFIKKFVRS